MNTQRELELAGIKRRCWKIKRLKIKHYQMFCFEIYFILCGSNNLNVKSFNFKEGDMDSILTRWSEFIIVWCGCNSPQYWIQIQNCVTNTEFRYRIPWQIQNSDTEFRDKLRRNSVPRIPLETLTRTCKYVNMLK